MNTPVLSRRTAFGSLGALIVTLTSPGDAAAQAPGPAPAASLPAPIPPLPTRLSSYVAVNADGRVTAFFGKVDVGQGLDTAIAQFVAEELDVAPGRVDVVMGDSARCVDQGGASNASGVSEGSQPLRHAAAEARLILLELAAARLGVPVAQLSTRDGEVLLTAEPARRVSYADLVAGRTLETELRWNGRFGNALNVQGRAGLKPVSDFRVIGTGQPRRDVADKAFGSFDFAGDARLPGMLHARMIRPPVAGSEPEAVDESSVRDIPGVRVVWRRGFLAVAAPREWDAVRARTALRVTWMRVAPPFPDQAGLYDLIRATPARTTNRQLNEGDVDAAVAGAARVITADYEYPFQSHSSMGPGVGLAHVTADGARVWTGTQKPHSVRDGVARLLNLPRERVHSVWMQGPGSYGRNDAGDAALDAAFLSRELGAPVRVQYTREEGHGWDIKSPATVHRMRAAIGADGRVLALEHLSKGFSRTGVATGEADPRDSMAGMMMGQMVHAADTFLFPGNYIPWHAYNVPSKRMEWQVIPPPMDRASPLRTGHLRDPCGPELIFAGEGFLDEVAHAVGQDALAFRLAHSAEPRDAAVLRAAAERFGWESRVSGSRGGTDDVVRGRGVSLSRRDGSHVALVAEVEVNRRTGHARATRLVAAHDCGLIVNPVGLRRTVEAGLIYALSRTMHEEVTFSRDNVTSVDWEHYPILDITDAPRSVEVVLIDRPDRRSTGAGEPMVRSVAAAVANAFFDATGVRIRRVPFTADRVKATLASV